LSKQNELPPDTRASVPRAPYREARARTQVCWHEGLLDAVVALCGAGAEGAAREGMRVMLNVADVELEACEAFIDGVFRLRERTEEAVNPPPVVLAALILQGNTEHPCTELSAYQRKLLGATLAERLSIPLPDVAVTKVAPFGKSSLAVHVLLQFSLEHAERAAAASDAIIRDCMGGGLAADLQVLPGPARPC